MRFLNLGTLCLVNLMWAAQYPAYKVASDHLDAASLNFWTLLIGALLLLPFFLRERAKAKPQASTKPGQALLQFTLLAILGILPPSVLLAWGISHSTAANAAILSLTIPVLMVLMAFLLLGEHLTLIRILSLTLALGGTLLISRQDLAGGSFTVALLAGNAVILLAGAGSAFYNVFSKNLLQRFTELEVLMYGYVIAIICCAVLSITFDSQPFYRASVYPMSAWLALLVLGGLSWGLAMVLWMWVLKRLAVSQVSASIYLLSFFGVILSALTLRERLHAFQLAGGVLVFAGAFLTSEYESRRLVRQAEAAPSNNKLPSK
ncbi:MAG: DMT family transporter [Acidobacteriaceae bacterium]|nr:DMT family transporter [Acidobacteriaceae bacterium]